MKITFAILGMFLDKLKVPNHEVRKFAWNWKEHEVHIAQNQIHCKGMNVRQGVFFKNNNSQTQYFFHLNYEKRIIKP